MASQLFFLEPGQVVPLSPAQAQQLMFQQPNLQQQIQQPQQLQVPLQYLQQQSPVTAVPSSAPFIESDILTNKSKFYPPSENPLDYEVVSFQDAMYMYGAYDQMTGVALYTRNPRLVDGKFLQPADILMVMRSDGTIGFPGGKFESGKDKTIVESLNRELKEEIALRSKLKLEQNDHVMTLVHNAAKAAGHMYAKEVSPKEYNLMEMRITSTKAWGNELLGFVRVPLYVGEDGVTGLPTFLKNKFFGVSKGLLIKVIKQRQLMPPDQLAAILDKSTTFHAY